MAVLIEGISIVIKADRADAAFGGDWQAFVRWVPNRTMCCDRELVRIGFMAPPDVKRAIDALVARGLVHMLDGHAVDMVVVDQLRGPCQPCSWIEFGSIAVDGDEAKMAKAARLVDSRCPYFMRPDGWTYERSLTADHRFVPTGDVERAFTHVTDPRDRVRTMTDHQGKRWFLGHPDIPGR